MFYFMPCRSLIANAQGRKKFEKGAIKVEMVSTSDKSNLRETIWDSISSGDGDMMIDDMAKSFSSLHKKLKR